MSEFDDIQKLKAIYDEMVVKGQTGIIGHSFYGPACMHGRHALCSVTCPYCTSPCLCACHTQTLTR